MKAPLVESRPSSLNAERTVLGALLLDADRIVDIAAVIGPDDFLDPIHADIYRAILSLYERHQSIDFVTVTEELREHRAINAIGGSAFLAQLAQEVPTSSHAQTYAKIIKDRAVKRRLQRIGSQIQKLSDKDQPAAELVDRAEQKLLSLSRSTGDSRPMLIHQAGEESYERYAALYEADDKAAIFGITTGFPTLDHLLAGLPPGHLMIVAARPSVGKTAFALDVARNIASTQHKNVAIFSLEMTRQEIMDRIVAGFLEVEAWKLKQGHLTDDQFQRLGPLFDQLKGLPIYIDDDPDTTLAHLRSKARRLKVEVGLDLLIIDYLQLIEVPEARAGENRTQQVAYISRSLKNLARELQCPIVALSQLSRSCEQRNPPIPVLSDLRESGSIEQDADSVLMLYREGNYNEDCDAPTLTDFYLRKNRNGPTGHIELKFNAAQMSFMQ